ncbi:MAG: hypothetical protein AAGA27_00855 [Pseudomonadota bacterium]
MKNIGYITLMTCQEYRHKSRGAKLLYRLYQTPLFLFVFWRYLTIFNHPPF